MKERIPIRYSWIDLIGIATLLVVTGLAFSDYAAGDQRRWLALLAMLVVIVVQAWSVQNEEWELGRVGLLTLLSLLLIILSVNFTALIMLYFVYSGHALQAFSQPRIGYSWILLFGLLTVATLLHLTWPDWRYALVLGLGTTCGYLFMGSAAHAQKRAEQASAESQRLLTELQSAHRQLQEQALHAEQLAVAEERNRLSREMHDTLGHRLTVAAVQLEGAQKLITRDPDKAAGMVATVRQQVMEGLTELRRTVAALRLPLEEDLPLRHTLTHLVTNFSAATGIRIDLSFASDLPDLPDLPITHRQTIYRTVQEALTNVQRHAQANKVVVNLAWQDVKNSGNTMIQPQLQILVEDNGVGLPQEAWQSGFGLRGLQERAEQLGGQLVVNPGVNGGVRVVVTLPTNTKHTPNQSGSA